MPEDLKDELSEESLSSNIGEDMSLLVLEMHGDIKKIEQHMEEITNLIASNAEDIDENADDLESLSEEVDQNKTKIKVVYGVATFIGAVAGAAAAAIPSLL